MYGPSTVSRFLSSISRTFILNLTTLNLKAQHPKTQKPCNHLKPKPQTRILNPQAQTAQTRNRIATPQALIPNALNP